MHASGSLLVRYIFADDDVIVLEFSSVAKSLKTLADAQIANTATTNAIQTAFAKEPEAQNQTAVRRDQLLCARKI